MATEDEKAESRPTRPAKTGAERVRKHRVRQRMLAQQAAFGIAKLVLGKGAGEQRRAVALFLEKAADDADLPEDIQAALDEAIHRLKARSAY